MDGCGDILGSSKLFCLFNCRQKIPRTRGAVKSETDRESMGVTEGEEVPRRVFKNPITHPQLTQAIVPWPFTVCATSDSSFRWESPDVAADTENTPRSALSPNPVNSSGESWRTQRNTVMSERDEGGWVTVKLAVLPTGPSTEERDHRDWDGRGVSNSLMGSGGRFKLH